MNARIAVLLAMLCLMGSGTAGFADGPPDAAVPAQSKPASESQLAALNDSDWQVRRTAAWALGRTRDKRAVGPLIAALKDRDWRVQRYAAWALGQVGLPAVEPILEALKRDDGIGRENATAALGVIGKPAVERLLIALHDANGRLRSLAAQALGKIKDRRALEPLIGVLKDEDAQVRRFAAGALGELQDARAVEPLTAAFKDRDAQVRIHVVDALWKINDRRVVEPLIDALKDEEVCVRRRASLALWERKDPRAVDSLVAALKDKDLEVRAYAARGLGELRDRRAVDPLMAAIRDPSNVVHKHANQALQKIAGHPTGFGWDAGTGPKWREWWKTHKDQPMASSVPGRPATPVKPAGPSPAKVRSQCAAVLANAKAGGYERAKAQLDTAKSYLDESNLAKAREEYGKVLAVRSHPFYYGEAHLGIGDACRLQRDLTAAVKAYNDMLAVAGSRQENQALARKRLDAIGLARRMRSDHPRLFFNADSWPAVEARLRTREKKAFDDMKRNVEGLPDEFGSEDWGNTLMQAALVYRTTGQEALFDKIRKMLHASLDFYDAVYAQSTTWQDTRRLGGLDYPFTRIGWLSALDWVWNDLTPNERQEFSSRMLRHVHEQLTRFSSVRYWHMAFYHSDNLYWHAGLTLLDSELADADYLRALDLLEEGFQDHQKMLKIRGEARGDDGDFTTVQIEYTLAGDPHAEWHFLHAWQSAVSREIPEPWRHSSLFPNYVLWNMLPGMHHYGLGFAWHSSNRLDASTLAYHLGQHMHFYGQSDPQMAALARYLQDQMGTRGSSGRLAVDPQVWSNPEPAPPARLPDGLPLARCFEGSGSIFMRSGHGPDDTYALFNAGGGRFASDHYDSTHFTLFKRGFLALDSGTRNVLGHSGEYYPQTVAHNCVLIRMPGEKFCGEWNEPIESNTAGQNRRARMSKLLAFEHKRAFTYSAADATATYDPLKCSQMVRQFIFLPPDHFVVFDRVTATRAEYPKTWLFHTANEPVVTGNESCADQGQGRIRVRTVYPADAVLEKVGGHGKEFWVDGKNWSLPDDWPYWSKVKEENRGIADRRIPETMGRWRIEVKPKGPRAEDHFLHLIQVGDPTLQKMGQTNVAQSPEQVSLEFAAGRRTYRVSLNKTREVGGHLRIREGDRVVVDQEFARGIMPQKGLATVEPKD